MPLKLKSLKREIVQGLSEGLQARLPLLANLDELIVLRLAESCQRVGNLAIDMGELGPEAAQSSFDRVALVAGVNQSLVRRGEGLGVGPAESGVRLEFSKPGSAVLDVAG